MPILRKLIRQELSYDSSTDIYLRCRVDLKSNAVGTEAPYFMHVGLPAVNESDEIRYFGTPATRIRRPADGSNWYAPGHDFGEVTVVGMIRTMSEQKHSYML